MDFNQTAIGLLIFYNLGALIMLIFVFLALPSIYQGPLKLQESK